MAWTAPRTWLVGEIAHGDVTLDNLNIHLRDNLNFLHDALLYDDTKASAGTFDTGAGGFSGAYKHLVGHLWMRHGGNSVWQNLFATIRFNNDSGTNYFTQIVQANAATRTGVTHKAQADGLLGRFGYTPDATSAGSFMFFVPNYASTTCDKAVICRWASKQGTSTGELFAGLALVHWNSTAAVSRIQIGGWNSVSGYVSQQTGSRFSLYGLV